MSFANPTPLRIGMTGSFSGKRYRIVGRSVLGEDEDGETYYWNEFNLETDSGEAATLVFDESETRTQWRIFTLFNPDYPLTAADAATKRVGNEINLTGENVRISFRGSSQVYFIEGKGPEGEQVGSVAEYFNAVSSGIMQVVSWTGDEVEYYNGTNISRGLIAAAFNLPQESVAEKRSGFFSSFGGSGSGNYLSGAKFVIFALLLLLAFMLIFGRGCMHSSNYEIGPVNKLPAVVRPLEIGATGKLFDKNYHVTGHTVVDLADVGFNWERHEYELTDDYGTKFLLACGEKPNDSDWTFYEPFSPLIAPSLQEAASKKIGDTVELDGYSGKVTDIVLSTIDQADGYAMNGPKTGTIYYGLRGGNEYRTLLARWNADGIQFYRGRPIPAKNAQASFSAAK